jgi:hypothetical protein
VSTPGFSDGRENENNDEGRAAGKRRRQGYRAGDAAGQRTHVSSLLGVVALVVNLSFFTPFPTDPPEAALGAIVTHGVARLIEF